jgi:uncharacterized protein (DUF488 family)
VTLYTVGHSTRSAAELLGILEEARVEVLVDVRRFPASRRNPRFNRGALAASLEGAGLRYLWLGEHLGGRRRPLVPVEHSPNRAWTVEAFRTYADAMQTPQFLAAAAELEALAVERPTAVLCAERAWWKCHRRLIADWFVARGSRVVHLIEPGSCSEHRLTEWARVESGRLTYPGLL